MALVGAVLIGRRQTRYETKEKQVNKTNQLCTIFPRAAPPFFSFSFFLFFLKREKPHAHKIHFTARHTHTERGGARVKKGNSFYYIWLLLLLYKRERERGETIKEPPLFYLSRKTSQFSRERKCKKKKVEPTDPPPLLVSLFLSVGFLCRFHGFVSVVSTV